MNLITSFDYDDPAPSVSGAQHIKRAALPIVAMAAGIAASMGLPSPFRPGPSGTNNGKAHSSKAQRKSGRYQPTGDDRMKLEQAEAKRQRKQFKRAAQLARG